MEQSNKNRSYLTAIVRKQIPSPVRWILQNYKISGKILDFGCGKCISINPPEWDNYDPYHHPNGIKQKKYDVIFCTYVLCVLKRIERALVLEQIESLLKSKNGIAYISVRNDKPKQGWGFSKRNTYQGRTSELDEKLKLVHSNSQYRIYSLQSSK